ncbi:MAG: hypothetical protein EOO14_04210 [Chitinophagaceae bacterium]|nr:MAG: hypothetical protein EOO14_04210 [Chitinophagaceae bacterium]
MQGSKIRLSPSEAALVGNAEIILTKNSIIQKTVLLLAELQERLAALKAGLPPTPSPKISKGENYLGLPYVVLDYPRISGGQNLLFIRSMFWWGHFFSSTLQVAGTYKEQAMEKLLAAHATLAEKNYFVGIHTDPWQHHFDPENYRAIHSLGKEDFREILAQQSHIKIAARWSLTEWDAAANYLESSWLYLAGLVA